LKREGDQDQPILYTREGPAGDERALVDPTTLGGDGLTALDWWYPSPDGHHLAYGTSRNGDEWSTLRVLDVGSGTDHPEAIKRTRYTSLAWLPDASGFFYTRYPTPGTVPEGGENYDRHAFFHRLGEDPAADRKVFGEGRSPQDMLGLTLSDDGRWLVVTASQGWARTEVYLHDQTWRDEPFAPVVECVDALFLNPTFDGDRFFLLTNWEAPNYRVVSVDPTAPEPSNWETIIPESPDAVLDHFVLAGDVIVTHEMESATSRLRVYRMDGSHVRDFPLPGLGTVTSLDGHAGHPRVAIGYTSFVQPQCAFVIDLLTGARLPISPLPPAAGFDPTAIAVEQVRYPSKDGTPISMFLLRRADVPLDGTAPTILAAYGGFNISKTPDYRPHMPAWLERGGIIAIPNLRGGGEYGEDWHRAGMREHKQNVFDDFIAAAEWLIANGYTSAAKLGIRGGSNGGLLVGAAMTQRPDLVGAVFCGVPLLDMVRYHHFRIAKLWVPEYGSADDEDAFRWLHAYSPYHHVTGGTSYPPTLITTAEQDTRVDPLHARKMTALLQRETAGGDDRPILLRAEADAGHGIGKPLVKRIAEAADEGSFFATYLGLAWEER
ncbi:MAG: prolyl oligopeptidase family serine peptidase, partial [Chloroflexota bacterium]|nr:prolyl oligopeptidase family serine peptidase [Chloroflexota bacterium]